MKRVLALLAIVCLTAFGQASITGPVTISGPATIAAGSAAGGTLTFVQDNGSVANCQSSGAVTTLTCTITSNLTAGNLGVIACATTGTITGISDTHSTWTAVVTQSGQATVWSAVIVTGGFNTETISLTSGIIQCRFMEFHDAGGTPSQDGAGQNASGTSTTPTGGTLTPAGSSDLFVGMAIDTITGQVLTLTWSGATDEGYTSGNLAPFGVGYKIATTSATQTPTWSMTNSELWNATDAAFKP